MALHLRDEDAIVTIDDAYTPSVKLKVYATPSSVIVAVGVRRMMRVALRYEDVEELFRWYQAGRDKRKSQSPSSVPNADESGKSGLETLI